MINLYMAEIFNFSTIEKKTSYCNEWRTKSRPLFWSEGLTLPWVGKINELIVEKGEGGARISEGLQTQGPDLPPLQHVATQPA